MLDLARLQRIHLQRVPPGQRLMAALLALDYRFPRRTRIEIEGIERIPQDRPVFLAMNHTDRYNYWPLQYHMHTRGLRYTATWVKGKYYQHPLMAWFMDRTGNIPLPSRGYVVASGFQQQAGRKPDAEEYRPCGTWWTGDRSRPCRRPSRPGCRRRGARPPGPRPSACTSPP